MSAAEKATVALKEKEEEAAAIVAGKERIAKREHANRGGYGRIYPLDENDEFLAQVAERQPESLLAFHQELAQISELADANYLANRRIWRAVESLSITITKTYMYVGQQVIFILISYSFLFNFFL